MVVKFTTTVPMQFTTTVPMQPVYLLPLTLRVQISLRWCVLTAFCDKVCQWRLAGWWFSLVAPASSINKTDHQDITEILLKVTLNTMNSPLEPTFLC